MGDFTNPVEWAKSLIVILDWLISRIREVFVLFVVASLARWLPEYWLNRMGLDPQNHIYHVTVLRIWWGSLLYFIVFGGAEVIRRFEIKRELRHLSGDEKEILQDLISNDKKTCQRTAWHSGPDSLEESKIITIKRNVGADARDGGVLVCTIKSWIFRYLKKHRQLIGLA
jgi:hypothetical protein